MKNSYLFFLLLFSGNILCAQTWTGSLNTDWNTPANWSTGNVPLSTGNVTVPGELANEPVLSGPVTINSVTMQSGSRLDVNGYNLTLNGISAGSNITGAILNNSNAATDIVITLNTGTGGFQSFFRSNTVNDHLVFNITGSNNFFEGDVAPANQYNANVIFNIAGTLSSYISHSSTSVFNGNLTINRTVAGSTVAFNSGAVINGNFKYTNATSGNTILGSSSATNITGTIQVAVNYSTPAIFEMRKFINLTTGGTIAIQNSTGFLLENNSLKIATLNITGYKTGQYGYLTNNIITGNVTIADDATFSGGYTTSIANNIITGNTGFTNNGSNSFFDAPNTSTRNIYVGNVTFTGAGSGSLYIAYTDSLHCSGSVTINRTAAGLTHGFFRGGTIDGNLSYNNSNAGDTYFGGGVLTDIAGTINIAINNSSPGVFQLTRFTNQTGGGNINLQHTMGFALENNTLKLTSLNITGYKSGQHAVLNNNDITGNVVIADDASFSGGFNTYISRNTITGNTAFTTNGSTILYDRGAGGISNTYNGNVSFTRNAGTILIGEVGFSEIAQNLTLNAAAGITIGSLKFMGSGNSVLEQLGTQPIQISLLSMEKTGGGKFTLNDPVTITNTANLTNGNIYSTATNSITFADGSIYTGGSNASYINGPVTKIGATSFAFPVGKSGKIAPISIASTGVSTDAFNAEYFMSAPNSSGYNASLKDLTLHHISSREFWILNRTAGTSATAVTLNWDASRSGTVNNLPDLRVARWNGSLWKDEGQGFINGNNATGIIITGRAVNDFSPFTLASSSSLNPLPVTLLSFTATKNNKQVNLQWVAGNEINLLQYIVERSADGVGYSSLTTVPALGTSSQITYKANDTDPVNGINYYRLKITDIGGRFTYSNIATVNFHKQYGFSIGPNPAKHYIMITDAGNYMQVQIIDVAGKLVRQMSRSIDNRYNIYGLGKGLYVVRLIGTDKTASAKLLIE